MSRRSSWDAYLILADERGHGPIDVPIVNTATVQRVALSRFVDDGRLPLDNNISERNLRRKVLGRKNWLFLGSDEGARVNTILVTSSLAASSTASNHGLTSCAGGPAAVTSSSPRPSGSRLSSNQRHSSASPPTSSAPSRSLTIRHPSAA